MAFLTCHLNLFFFFFPSVVKYQATPTSTARITVSMFLFCFFQKKALLLCPIQGLGEGSRVVRNLPSGCKRGASGRSLDMRGTLVHAQLQRLQAMLEGEPFKEIFPNPTRGQPACADTVGQAVSHLLDVALFVSHRGGVVQAIQALCALVPALLHEKGGLGVSDFPTSSRETRSARPKRTSLCTGF